MSSNDKGIESRTNGWMFAGVVLMLIAVLAFPIYRIYEPTARAEAAEETQDNLARAGATLWTSTCAACHGSYGQGVDAPALNSVQFLTIATDEQIFSLVSSGIPGTDMAAYGQQFSGPLTRAQIAAVVACIRSWEEDAPDRPDWRDMLGADAPHDDAEDAEVDHDEEESVEGSPACGPGYDPESFEDDADHDEGDEDGDADHDEGDEDGDADHDESSG